MVHTTQNDLKFCPVCNVTWSYNSYVDTKAQKWQEPSHIGCTSSGTKTARTNYGLKLTKFCTKGVIYPALVN